MLGTVTIHIMSESISKEEREEVELATLEAESRASERRHEESPVGRILRKHASERPLPSGYGHNPSGEEMLRRKNAVKEQQALLARDLASAIRRAKIIGDHFRWMQNCLGDRWGEWGKWFAANRQWWGGITIRTATDYIYLSENWYKLCTLVHHPEELSIRRAIQLLRGKCDADQPREKQDRQNPFPACDNQAARERIQEWNKEMTDEWHNDTAIYLAYFVPPGKMSYKSALIELEQRMAPLARVIVPAIRQLDCAREECLEMEGLSYEQKVEAFEPARKEYGKAIFDGFTNRGERTPDQAEAILREVWWSGLQNEARALEKEISPGTNICEDLPVDSYDGDYEWLGRSPLTHTASLGGKTRHRKKAKAKRQRQAIDI